MTSLPLTPEQIEALRALAEKATPGEWRSMRDGNQYIQGELVGASRVAGIARPWNSQYVVPAEQLEEVCRFTDADADYIAAAQPRHILALLTDLLSTRTRLEEITRLRQFLAHIHLHLTNDEDFDADEFERDLRSLDAGKWIDTETLLIEARATITRLEGELASWRRVSERLEGEKRDEKQRADTLAAENARLREALTGIASFDDQHASERLSETGSFDSFDEPGAVKAARAALSSEEQTS